MAHKICHIECTCGNTERIGVDFDYPEPAVPFIKPAFPLTVYIEDIVLCSRCDNYIDAQSVQDQAEAEIQTYLEEVRAGI
jgi:hypothetical protein